MLELITAQQHHICCALVASLPFWLYCVGKMAHLIFMCGVKLQLSVQKEPFLTSPPPLGTQIRCDGKAAQHAISPPLF